MIELVSSVPVIYSKKKKKINTEAIRLKLSTGGKNPTLLYQKNILRITIYLHGYVFIIKCLWNEF